MLKSQPENPCPAPQGGLLYEVYLGPALSALGGYKLDLPDAPQLVFPVTSGVQGLGMVFWTLAAESGYQAQM